MCVKVVRALSLCVYTVFIVRVLGIRRYALSTLLSFGLHVHELHMN
jgi:hypothetical protein